MIKILLIIFSMIYFGTNAYAQQNFAMEKQFLATTFDCLPSDKRDECQRIVKASSYQDISELSLKAVLLSKKEEKELRNRISALDCCVSMYGGNACDGLNRELIKEACQCRKNLKIEIKDRLSCK